MKKKVLREVLVYNSMGMAGVIHVRRISKG
jgi:hypothetical protein